MPILTNLRLDPFERTNLNGSLNFYSWFVFEFWRFVYVQQEVVKMAETAIEFPPMQAGASFNMESVKQQIQKAIESQHAK
jgi:arylsulfatase